MDINVCEYYNKLNHIVGYIVCGERVGPPVSEVSLGEVIVVTIATLFAIVVLSWWMIPLRFIWKAIPNPTFYCKPKK